MQEREVDNPVNFAFFGGLAMISASDDLVNRSEYTRACDRVLLCQRRSRTCVV